MNDLTILHGDNTELCKNLAPRSIQCVVTSPPYYGLRDYGLVPTEYQAVEYQPMPGLAPLTIPAMAVCLGLESTPEAYIAHLVYLFRLIRPALADDGVMWVNIGDSYAMTTKGAGRAGKQQTNKGSVMADRSWQLSKGLKQKNLMGIPWRLAFALQADGWILRSDVIWHKPNAMPESVTDRCTKDHEYLFMLAKSPRYYFDNDAIKEQGKKHHEKAMSFQRDSGKVLENRNPGQRSAQHRPNRKQDAVGKSTYVGFNDRYTEDVERRNKRTVWQIDPDADQDVLIPEVWHIATKALAAAHYAPMPEALAEPCILSSSRVGDLVLDPFGGTGTTARVAIANNRHAISMDLNPAYIAMHDERTTVQRALVIDG